MKKHYINLLVFALLIVSASFAQNRVATASSFPSLENAKSNSLQTLGTIDTLTNHWDLIAPVQIDRPVTYSAASGFVAGQNNFGDKAKAQRFDSNYGVISGGTVNSLLLWFGQKQVGAGTASFTATIWNDNAGKPGTILGTATAFSITTIDTSDAALTIIGSASAVAGAYNKVAIFSSPISIPSNQIFWAGVSFTYANGDSAGLVTSHDPTAGDAIGTTGDFLFANTHTFEQTSNNSWATFNDGTTNATWGLDIALAVYPIVDLTLGVNELNSSVAWMHNTPNPASTSTLIEYELKESADVNLSLFDITGTKVLTLVQGLQKKGMHSVKMDVSSLSSGMYFYTLILGNHQTTQKLIVSK